MILIEIIVILAVATTVWFFFIRKQNTTTKTAEKENTNVQYTYSLKEMELIDKINYHRTSLGLSKLKVNNYITSKCALHNTSMASQRQASHDNFVNRAETIIYNLGVRSAGENVAYGFTLPASILNAWLKSPSHKETLENLKWTEMGLSITDKYVTNIFVC